MAASAHDATFPALPFRKLVLPAALWSAVAATVIILARRTRKPTVGLMSDEWLRNRELYRELER